MTRVSRDAGVHETTVQAVARGEYAEVRTTRRARSGKSSRVYTVRVDRRVWREARRLAGGDARRLEIEGPDSVLVHNSPDWRRRAGH